MCKSCRQQHVFTAAVFTLLMAAPALARADVEYELVIIEPWNTSYSLASSGVGGLNNLNQVTGCATTAPLGGPCSFIWTLETGKVPINLAGPINDLGVITSGNYIRWPDGTLQQMDGAMGDGADLNNANVVAGTDGELYWCEYGEVFPNREAAVWSPEGGSILVQQQLGVPAADQAWAVNNNNQFVGVRSTTGMCGDQKAFYYDLNVNQYVDLHTLLTGSSSGITHAVDINDAGIVIGDGPVSIGGGAFLWSAGAGFTFFPSLPGTLPGYSIPSSINNAGTVVGQAIVNEWWHAWIWDEQNGIRDLNEITEGIPPNFAIVEARKINDNGWIIGRGHYGDWSPTRAVVLIPLHSDMPGDIDGDGDVDMNDAALFIDVLLGIDNDAGHQLGADLNADGAPNGGDVSLMTAALIGS